MKKILLATSAALLIGGAPTAFAQDHEHEGHASAPRAPAAAAAPARPAAPQGAAQQGGGFRGGAAPHQWNGAPGGAHWPQSGGQPQGARPQFGGQPGERPDTGGPRFPGGQGGYRPQPGQPGYRDGGFHGQQGPAGQGSYHPQQPGRFGERQTSDRQFDDHQYNDRQGGFHGGYQAGRGGPPAGWRGPRPGAQPFTYGGRQFYRYRTSPYAYPRGYYGWAHHGWRRGEWLPSVFIAENYFINDWYDFGLYEPEYGYEWIRVGADALLIDASTGEVVDVVPGVYYW